MMQLTYLYFTAQRADQDAFQSWKNKTRAQLQNQEAQPIAAFQDTLNRLLYNDNPFARMMKADDVDKVDYDRVMQIAKERFANAKDFTFIITGAFDEATMLPLVAQYIGGLPSKGKAEKAKSLGVSFAEGNIDNEFAKKMEVPMAIVLYMETAKGKFNLRNELTLDIAQQILDIIYTEEIREKEGGTYGVSTAGGYNYAYLPETQSYLQIVYQTSPEEYARLNKRIEELLADFSENGPSEANIAKVKDYMHKKHQENLRENRFWSSTLKDYLKYGVDYDTDYEEVLDSITAEDIRAAIADLLAEKNQLRVIMYGITE